MSVAGSSSRRAYCNSRKKPCLPVTGNASGPLVTGSVIQGPFMLVAFCNVAPGCQVTTTVLLEKLVVKVRQITDTVKPQELPFPAASWATQETFDVPGGKRDPEGGLQVTMPLGLQLPA